MTFIKELFKKRSNYNDPDQATMQENSLEKLSSGIYTEGERFIFELLQNAVDAHSNSDCLEVSICIRDGYLVFMHNGDAFTNEDIEGICFVGRKGEKVRNTKKIGYKGIGFKSVFGISSKVYIRTGSQCFRFDKDYWRSYWNEHWNPSFGPKLVDLSEYTMPWQVIPIESEVPISLDERNANVSTYIAIDPEDEQKLVDSIKGLLQSCRFLIFLKDNNIKMSFTYHGNTQCSIEKRTLNGEVVLYLNGIEDSRWMVYQNPEVPLNLTEEQKRRIEKHKSTPDKLKNATSFDLSFAIAVEEGKLKKADNAVLYSYLPTSYSFGEGFPFLVNANFITDEGRQHLDVDAEWNKVLISKIPEEYLKWVASFSKKHSNYYEILPKKSYGSTNDLLKIYEEAMKDAIERIAFIPSAKCNNILKVDDSIFDRMNIAEAITPQMLIAHINRIHNKYFLGERNIIKNEGHTILKSYGVFDFNKKKFKAFFEDSHAITGIAPESDAKLINLLCFYHKSLSSDECTEFEHSMKDTKFVLNQNNSPSCPKSLSFSALQSADYSSDIDYISDYVLQSLDSESIIWLKNLGVSEPSDVSLVTTGKLFEEGYVTKDNAIGIGKYFFNLFKKGRLDSNILSKLGKMFMLTQKGNLKQASQLYLSNAYRPELPVEDFVSIDTFVSDEYIGTSSIHKLKSFLLAIGLSDNLDLSFKRMTREVVRKDYAWANDFWVSHNTQPYISRKGTHWDNPITSYNLYIFSLYQYITEFEFAKLFWPEAFKTKFNRTSRDSGYVQNSWQKKSHIDDNFFEWSISNKAIIPTTQHKMEIASNVFVNHLSELCGTYLPVIDINSEIPLDWINLLHLKQSLEIEDMLMVLRNISQESNSEIISQNKYLITNIYSKIADELPHLHSSKINTIKDWSKENKILSNGEIFVLPKELNYVTIDGSSSKKQVYIGKQKDRDGVLKLLSLMGVKIITEDNVIPTFDNDILNTDIPTRLLSVLPVLAVLARDCNERKSYQEYKEILQRKIENTEFNQCQKIKLAYDDSGDTISKIAFAKDDKFYFIGELRPAKIEPLLHPLCSYLGIKGKERELFVIMTEPEFSGIIEYLEDKEYDVADVKLEMLPIPAEVGSVMSVGGQIGGGIEKAKQIADSNEAKALVLAKLGQKGFDVSDVDSDWSIVKGVTRDGISYPLVVKSCKNWDHKLFLNPDEWRQLFKPNSMLWLHLGNSVVAPIKAHELFTYQDKLSLTFDTVNLMMDDRINKIMEVMRYFNNVHLDVATLNPDKRRAEHLEEYLFNNNNIENSDLDDNVEL